MYTIDAPFDKIIIRIKYLDFINHLTGARIKMINADNNWQTTVIKYEPVVIIDIDFLLYPIFLTVI